MTQEQELRYLTDLLLQASRWERSEGEVLSGLELEVQDRVRRLTGVDTVDDNGMAQSVVERGLAKAEAKKAKSRARRDTQRNSRRVTFPDGSTHRVAADDLHQEPFPQSPTGYRWAINEDAMERYLQRYGIK